MKLPMYAKLMIAEGLGWILMKALPLQIAWQPWMQ
jgi:hypothetical protein